MRKQESNDKTLAPATTLGAREEQDEQTGLAPCPFDGGKCDIEIAPMEPPSYSNHKLIFVGEIACCNRVLCGARMSMALNDREALKRELIRQWNKRAALIPTASAQPQVAEGKEEPVAQSGWIKTAERPPTKEDADIWGNVFVADDEHGREGVDVTSLDNATTDQWPFWMPIPPVPRGQQKDLGER